MSGIEVTTVDRDPIRQFESWYEDARRASIRLYEAMALATAGPDGRPSVRMVLLKGIDRGRFVFYTNFESPKAVELDANPRAELLFHWKELDRQVRIAGTVDRVPADDADAYFATRPRRSQLSAWASPQSSVLDGRGALEERMAELEARYPGEVPRPPHWGGYRLEPERIELWLNRDDRLHDRVRYLRQDGGGWRIERLAP